MNGTGWRMAALLVAVATPALAKVTLTPGTRPTVIEPGRKPFVFAVVPTVRESFKRDEPFLDGVLTYGYTGRLTTPLMRGKDAVAPAGSPAYGVPITARSGPGPELMWCAATRKTGSAKIGSVCMLNEGLGFGGYDALMTTAGYVLDTDPFGGGDVTSAPFDLGAPVRLRLYVQNLGKIARLKAQILVGDAVANQWGYQFGDIGRGSQPAERLFAVGGGVIGISRDEATKDGYRLRVIRPLEPGGAAPLTEVRNDSRVRPAGP